MRKILISLCGSSLLFFSACHKAKIETRTESHLDRATLLMDQGDYSSAIELLEDAISHEQNTQKLRLVLASAYAGRAGIKVESYWDYLVGFDAFVNTQTKEKSEDLVPRSLLPDNANEDLKKQIAQLNKYYQDLRWLEFKTKKIPELNQYQRSDLKKARIVIENQDAPGSRLYRSMLTAVLVKSNFVNLDQTAKVWIHSNYNFCDKTISEFSKDLAITLDLVSDGLNDLGIAYPEENEGYQKTRTDIKNGIRLLQIFQKNLSAKQILCTYKK